MIIGSCKHDEDMGTAEGFIDPKRDVVSIKAGVPSGSRPAYHFSLPRSFRVPRLLEFLQLKI